VHDAPVVVVVRLLETAVLEKGQETGTSDETTTYAMRARGRWKLEQAMRRRRRSTASNQQG